MRWEVIGSAPSLAASVGALQWAVMFAVPGAAWAWALRRPDGRAVPGPLARTLIAGLAVNLGLVLALGAAGCYTPVAELAALAGVTAIGVAAGGRRCRPDAGGALGALLLLAAGALVTIAWPRRGEWILGGWDPGVYVHQGVTLERHHTLGPVPDRLLAALQPDEIALFTRPEHSELVLLPGVPIDADQRLLVPAFPHANAAWIARAQRCMGLRGAVRANHLAAWVALLLTPVAARSLGLSRRAGWLAAATLAMHPVVVQHTAFPTSELLHLALLQGMASLWPLRRAPGAAMGVSALMLLAVVNRPSFLPFGGMLTALAAVEEAAERRRRAVRWRRLLQVVALAGGAMFVMKWNATLLSRWGAATTWLAAGFVAGGGVAVLVDLAASVSVRLRRLAAHPGLGGGLMGLAALAMGVAWGATQVLSSNAALAARAWAAGAAVYAGAPFLLAAALGWALVALRRDAGEAPLRTWLAFLLFCVAAALAVPQITIWWPWASRRLLEAALPAVALGVGAVLDRLGAVWPAPHARWRPAALTLALGLVVLPSAGRWRAAVCAAEYNGATAALAPVIARLGPRDLVVADHFWWAAPLRFLADVPVVNGELFWAAEDDGDRQRLAMTVLARLRREGWRIRLLSSTDKALAIYPLRWEGARLEVDAGRWTAGELLQHPRARGYTMRQRERRFRLFNWEPPCSTGSRRRPVDHAAGL
ncbi:MAG: hypothetical protein N2652_04040 [Kiritimatiellae bacterium]|nr:hypothetical protein [Kiritimatiellia bacterium]